MTDFEMLPPAPRVNRANVLTVQTLADIPRENWPDGTLIYVESYGSYYRFEGDACVWWQIEIEPEYWYIHLENELFATVDERNVSPFVITARRDEAYRFSTPEAAYRAVERVRSLSSNNDWAVLSSRA